MSESLKTDGKQWYVLNFINKLGKLTPQKYIDVFNKEGHSLELFAPIIRPAHVINGQVKYVEKLLTFFYVFVRGTFDEIKELCSRPDNNLSFVLDRSSANKYGIISDADMENFKIIARAYSNTIPFFDIKNIELAEGDLVEVVDGECAGLKGTFMPKSRSNKGNLVIAVTAALGAVVWDVDAKYIRILEFAHDTRRQYDLVDSFIPKLFPVLRKFHAREELSDKEKSILTVFNQRMGVVAPSNPKAEAKLLAVLMCVQFILGDLAGLRSSQLRYEKRKASLTNVWTQALIELILSTVLGDKSRLKEAYESIRETTNKLSNTQKQLLEEYRYYLNEQ